MLKEGILVRTTYKSCGFYSCGALARLVYQDDDGDWWADFKDCGNDLDTYLGLSDGIWCVSDRFEVVEEG